MLRRAVFALFLLLCIPVSFCLASPGKSDPPSRPLFVENKGQWPDEVLFHTRLAGLDAWITKQGMTCDFFSLKQIPSAASPDLLHSILPVRREYTRSGQVVRTTLIGAAAQPVPQGEGKSQEYYNYLFGADPSGWTGHVGLYADAWVRNAYAGIDLHYYFEENRLRYDYVLAPGADAAQISMELQGADDLPAVNAEGELEFHTRFGAVKQAKLFAYQTVDGNKQPISCRFRTDPKGRVHFDLGPRRPDLPVVIDPLIYSTYLGVTGDESASFMVQDASGNLYLAGSTSSANFPTTTGAYTTSYSGGQDAFVTKLNAGGTSFAYSTFLGGTDADQALALALDASGNAYVVGVSRSVNFPVTAGAYQTVRSSSNTSNDLFVAKLSAGGSSLSYSTYLGGTLEDYAPGIAVDGSGNACVAGYTQSTNYPTTGGAYQVSYGGGNYDAFVTKLNGSGTALLYSTYLGGTREDEAFGIAMDASGNAYVTGGTSSSGFPTTVGAYQRSYNATYFNGFVTKLNAAGSLSYSTYLGGNNFDYGRCIKIDAAGNAYLTGTAGSANFPVTAGAYQTTFGGGYDAFVTKLNAGGGSLGFSTYLGGSDEDRGNGIALDGSGNIYLTGRTQSTDFRITTGAFQSYHGAFASQYTGHLDAFVTKLNPAATALINSTYLGGSNEDEGMAIVPDGSGNAYVTGYTQSGDFPTTANAYQANLYGTSDAFLTRLEQCQLAPATVSSNGPLCEGNTLQLTATGGFNSYVWTGPNGFNSTQQNPSRTNTAPADSGYYFVTVADNNGCTGTIPILVSVKARPPATISYSSPTFCNIGSASVTRTGLAGGNYTSASGLSLNFATGTIDLASSTPGTYTVSYNVTGSNGCATTATAAVTINAAPTASISYAGAPYCTGNPGLGAVTRTGTAGGTYSAAPGGINLNGTNGDIDPSTSSPGTYTVTYTFGQSGCTNSTTASVTINSSPTASISYAGSPYCTSGSATVSRIGQAGGTYASTSGLSLNSSTGTINLSASTPGTYTVTYSFSASNGCTGSATTSVTVTAPTTASISYPGSPYCASGTATVSQSGQTGGNYTSASGLNLNFVSGEINLAGSTPGTYTVTYSFSNGGCSGTATTTVTVSAAVTAAISYSGSPYCANGTAAVTQTGQAGGNYTSTAGLSLNPTTGAINLSASTPGTYTVTYSFSGNGCSGYTTAPVTVNPATSAAISYAGSPFCATGTAAVTQTGQTGGTYASTGGLSLNPATGEVNLSASAAGTYTVTYRFGSGSCAGSATASITVRALPAFTAGSNGPVCSGATIRFFAPSGYSSYSWSGPNGFSSSLQNPTIARADATDAGIYQLQLTNASGCSGSDTLALTVRPAIDVFVSLANRELQARQSGAAYQWLRCAVQPIRLVGATAQTYRPTTSGNYAVAITLNGCSDTSDCVSVNLLGVEEPAYAKTQWSVFPNPSHGTFTISSAEPSGFELTDLQGRTLRTCEVKSVPLTVTTELAPGFYFLRCRKDGTAVKLVIE